MTTRKRSTADGFGTETVSESVFLADQTVEEVEEDLETLQKILEPDPEPEPEPIVVKKKELKPKPVPVVEIPVNPTPVPTQSISSRPRRNIPRFSR